MSSSASRPCCSDGQQTYSTAANKVFLYCRAAPAARGPSPLAVGLIESHGAGASGKPRQGRPDAAGARGAGSGMAGCRPGACGPRAIRPGDGRQRGIIQQARVPTDGQTPRNVAVEPAGAVPGHRGTGGCGCPVRRALSRHYAQRRERPGRTRTLPPFGTGMVPSVRHAGAAQIGFDLREAGPIADTAVSHAGSALCGVSSVVSSVRVPAGPTGEPRGRRRCNSWP